MADSNTDIKTLGLIPATFLVGNAAIGAGILNFPEAVRFAGGPIMAMILQIFVLALVTLGLVIIGIMSVKLNCPSMQSILLQTSGKPWNYFSIITIILYSFFCCVAYHIVIGDQFDSIFYTAIGKDFCHTWYYSRYTTIPLSAIIIILPFIFPKKIDFLKYLSSVGVIAIFYVVGLVTLEYFLGDISERGEVDWFPQTTEEYLKIMMTVPPFCFAYHAHVQSVPVFWCMKSQTSKSIIIVCVLAMIGIFILYSVTGIFGYLTFGRLVKSNILSNYMADNAATIIALIIVAFKICCVYPIVVFCGRDAVIDLYVQIANKDPEVGNLRRRIIVALSWFILAVILAVAFPNIGVVIDVLGFFVAFFIFVFPGVTLKNISKEDEANKTKYFVLGIILMIIGYICAIMAFSTVIYRLSTKEEVHQLLCT